MRIDHRKHLIRAVSLVSSAVRTKPEHYSQEPIHCNDESDVIGRQSNRGQYDHHGYQPRLWDACSSDASCGGRDASQSGEKHVLLVGLAFPTERAHLRSPLPDGDDLTKVHLHVVDLGDEDGRQRLVQRRPVHVDGGADGEHKTRDPLVDLVVLLQTFKGDGQRSRAGRRQTGENTSGWLLQLPTQNVILVFGIVVL